MRRLFGIFMMVIALFVIGATSALAQDADATEEVPVGADESALVTDVSNTLRQSVIDVVAVVVSAIGAVVVILAGTFAIVIAKLGGHLSQSVPMYYRDSVNSFLDTFTLRLQELAKKTHTPFEFDDVFANKLREAVLPIIQNEVVAIAKKYGAPPNGDAVPNG